MLLRHYLGNRNIKSESWYIKLEVLQCKNVVLFKPDCGVDINIIPLHIFVGLSFDKKVKIKPTKAKITN